MEQVGIAVDDARCLRPERIFIAAHDAVYSLFSIDYNLSSARNLRYESAVYHDSTISVALLFTGTFMLFPFSFDYPDRSCLPRFHCNRYVNPFSDAISFGRPLVRRRHERLILSLPDRGIGQPNPAPER